MQVLDEFIGHLENGIAVGMFTACCNAFVRNLVGTLFTGNPGKENLMLDLLFINHNHLDQVFIQGSIQTMQTNWTKEINTFPFLEVKPWMCYTRVISHFRMK